jgi:predicted dehydrogenase
MLRGALVGFGFIAERGHVPAYASREAGLQIVAVAEPCTARHPSVGRVLPGARIYTSHEELLRRERLDFVDICTPPSVHASIAVDALRHGLHVLCEKPLATSRAEVAAMCEHAQRAQRVLFPTHAYLHAPVVNRVRGLLQSGRIGSVHLATIDTYRTGHARGVVEWNADWRRDRRFSGGGILMDHGPHTAYLAFEWMGGHPTSVRAWTASPAPDAVEDDAVCTMTFPSGIVRAHLTWNAGLRRVIYTLHGSHGAIRVEDDEVELIVAGADGRRSAEKSTQPSSWHDAGHGPWFVGVLRSFERAVQQREWLSSETRDAVAAIHVVTAAVASARRQGAPVAIASASTSSQPECVA